MSRQTKTEVIKRQMNLPLIAWQKRINLSYTAYPRYFYLRRISDGRVLERGINADKNNILSFYRQHLRTSKIDLEFQYIHNHIH